jgi:hypothetical protein
MRKFGGYLFGLSLVLLLQFCFLAIGAQAQYTVTLTATPGYIYMPSTQTITWSATISPGAGSQALQVDLQDTTGNIGGTIGIPEYSSMGSTTIGTTGTITTNTTDQVTGYVSCTGCTSTSNQVTINLIANTPTLTFLTVAQPPELNEGASTYVRAYIAVPTDFAITINEIFSPTGDLSIGTLQIAQGDTTSNEATATAGGTNEVVTVTPFYNYDDGGATMNGESVNVTIEP